MDESVTPATPEAPAAVEAAAPVADLIALVESATQKVLDDFKAAKADGHVGLGEVIQLCEDLVDGSMSAIKTLKGTAADRAAVISAALTRLYNEQIRPLELKHFGAFVSAAFIDPLVSQLIPMLIASAEKLILSKK